MCIAFMELMTCFQRSIHCFLLTECDARTCINLSPIIWSMPLWKVWGDTNIIYDEFFFSVNCRYFNYLSVCKVEEGWYESRFKGVFPSVLNDEWKYYSFRLVNDTVTKLKLGLFQKSMR